MFAGLVVARKILIDLPSRLFRLRVERSTRDV
jgi:hypothetical protein